MNLKTRLDIISYLLQHPLNESVSKAEGGSSKRIEDGWVDGGIVSVAISICDRDNVKFIHKVNSKDYWEPLIVSYVLK